MTEEQTESPIQLAQKRLADAAMGVPLSPSGAAMSAYVNGILQSARVDALVELWLVPPNATWSKQEAYDAALVGALTARTQMLEAKALEMKKQIEARESRIQVAEAMPGSAAEAVRRLSRSN